MIRRYLCQTEVTISILLFNTDHLCCYLPCCQMPLRCSPGLCSGYLRDSLRARGTKSPFRVAKQETAIQHASSSSMFWSQFYTQDISLRMNSWTFPPQQITFTKPCFHWGYKIMRPLFCLFSLLCVLTQSHVNLDLTYKTIKNEQTCMILGGMFHISQGGGCHLLCK